MPGSSLAHTSREEQDAPAKTAPIRLASSHPSSATELASLKIRLKQSIRQFPDFPAKGILFEDILPLFANPNLHQSLIRALELHVRTYYGGDQKPDVVVGLEARGFLFGPSLALALGAGFVPIRKKGKLPGPTETAVYEKEYGKDLFEIQTDAIKQGQRVLIVDDIIATGILLSCTWPLYKLTRSFAGGSAAAAGSLVGALGGTLLGYVFLLELDFLNGREKLNAPAYILLSSQESALANPS